MPTSDQSVKAGGYIPEPQPSDKSSTNTVDLNATSGSGGDKVTQRGGLMSNLCGGLASCCKCSCGTEGGPDGGGDGGGGGFSFGGIGGGGDGGGVGGD